MASTVRTRPSHYAVLGLEPTATSEEIARAFARETGPFQPRPLGGIAQVISAYEVLRDPDRRRAYDESIGVRADPRPDPSPTALVLRGWAGMSGSAAAAAGDRPAHRAVDTEAAARPEPVPERRPGSVYGAAPREPLRLAAPEPRPQTRPKPLPREVVKRPAEQSIEELLAMYRAAADRPADAGPSPIEWQRPGLAIGAAFAAIALLGASIGWWTANDIEPLPGEAAALIAPPAAEARPATDAPAPLPSVEEEAPAAAAPARVERAPAPPERPVVARQQPAEDRQVAEGPAQPGEAEELAVEEVGAEAPSPAAVAATLPLPNRVVARTIERIGYACGEVAATTPVEGGGSGVFKVTCTSGQSYQARPVGGRYRFRRWSGG